MTHHPWSTSCLLSEEARLTHNEAYYGWSAIQFKIALINWTGLLQRQNLKTVVGTRVWQEKAALPERNGEL